MKSGNCGDVFAGKKVFFVLHRFAFEAVFSFLLLFVVCTFPPPCYCTFLWCRGFAQDASRFKVAVVCMIGLVMN